MLQAVKLKLHRCIAISAVLIAALFVGAAAQAQTQCPDIHGLIDRNCDGIMKFTFTGDSITFGFEDWVNPIEGYPGRLQKLWPWSRVENLGIPGITSQGLLQFFKQNLAKSRPGLTEQESRHSDIFFIAVGINDYWSHHSPALTVTTIARLVTYVRTTLKRLDGSAPLILVATLTPTHRAFQQPFVNEVNKLLLHYHLTSNLPVYVRFDELDVKHQNLLNSDGLHPNGQGYTEMMKIVKGVITGKAQVLLAAQEPTPTPTSTPTPAI